MPIYVYRPVTDDQCDHCGEGFEHIQKLNSTVLVCCPECSAPIERVITAANLASPSPSLKEANLDKHGFTQYRKVEKGVYEKTTGKGPEIISNK